jgi:hypothetical protein
MKKLPIGISTFAKIRENECYYIDKTDLIKRLVDHGEYYFLSRPRRFGKSLFLDTLKSAFEGKKELFKGLYLENNWNFNKKFPVLSISFGAGMLQSQKELDETFQGIFSGLKKKFDLDLSDISYKENFRETIHQLHEKFNEKVVILVDEYDKPILDNITDPATAALMRDNLKNFYSVIKDADAVIRFVFITGVSKFSKVSLFSGLNNLEDITLDANYSIICGYTQNDLERQFKDRLGNADLNEIQTWYNGYNWLGESVYNPFDILLFFSKGRTFRNYWFETGNPSFLIKLFKEKKYFIPDLEKVEVTESLIGSFDVDSIEVETLLFQTGYLTIKKEKRIGPRIKYELKYPNLEVQYSLNDYILDYLTLEPVGKSKHQDALYFALEAGDPAQLHKALKRLFASIPYNNFSKNKIYEYEGYYVSVIYSYFAALGVELVAEDVTNRGWIDLTVKLSGRVYIIEFKVTDKRSEKESWEGSDDGAEKKCQPRVGPTRNTTALAQIKDKKYYEKYLDYKEIYLIGIEFSKTEKNITGYDWEQISPSLS